jgi:hypothetical protein
MRHEGVDYRRVFTAHLDESYDPERRTSRVFVVGGFVAHDDEWVRFESAWQACLDSAGIERFHMREFEHAVAQFEGWERGRRYELIGQLAGIINDHRLFGISSALDTEAYERVFLPALPSEDARILRSPYVFCEQACLEHLAAIRDQIGARGHQIRLVFENNRDVSHVARVHARDFLEFMEWQGVFSPPEFAPSTLPGLQAADIFAYESFKHVTNQFTSPMPVRPMRKLLERLEGTGRHRGGYHDERELRQLVERARADGKLPT